MPMDLDPAPLFALSLPPYLLFLHWLRQSDALPPLALWGFRLTLLFVLVTIAAAIVTSTKSRVKRNPQRAKGGSASL